MKPNGSDLTQRTADTARHGSPDWSPDGRQIAFSRFHGPLVDIFVMNADGSNVTQITQSGGAVMPAWSPNGQRIAFATWDGGRAYGVSIMNADGSDVTTLTQAVGRPTPSDLLISSDNLPSWSPDGRQIAFVRKYADGNISDIFVMNADGSGITQLTYSDAGVGIQGRPAWSPNGQRIAFAANRDTAGHYTNRYAIFTMNADGSGMLQLTTGLDQDFAPGWSPNGRRIMFLRRCSGNGIGMAGFFIMDADGGEVTQVDAVLADAVFGGSPQWTQHPLLK